MKKKIVLITMFALSLSLVGNALANTEWDGSESSDWTDPNNWTNDVPGASGYVDDAWEPLVACNKPN